MWKQYGRETQEVYEIAKWRWEQAVYSAKQRYWREKPESVSKDTIWAIIKKQMQTHNRMTHPLDEAETFENKADARRRTPFLNNPSLSFLRALQLRYRQKHSDIFIPINPAEVCRALRKRDSNTGCGHDQIGNNVVKQLHTTSRHLFPYLVTAILKYSVHHTE
jgi:hypothetical protein